MAWLIFIQLDKAVVHVIRLASFLWLWLQCVCLQMPSHNTYHHTWISLTFNVGYLHSCSSKAQLLLLTLDEGISSWPPLLTLNVKYLLLALLRPCSCHSSDLWFLLSAASPEPWVCGAPLGCRPDLGHGVTPLSRSCADAGWPSRSLPTKISWILITNCY